MATLASLQANKTRPGSSSNAGRRTVQFHEATSFTPKPSWAQRFEDVSGEALEKYLAGHREVDTLFTDEQVQFLATLGSTPQEVYDFIEDWCEYGEPSFETALRVTEVRAEYFLQEQQGTQSTKIVTPDSLPARNSELGGFVWLPRIIAKAQAKLRGEMSPEIMFGCAGDRAFLQEVGIDVVQFLRVVWSAGDDLERIAKYVQTSADFHETLLPYHLKLLKNIA